MTLIGLKQPVLVGYKKGWCRPTAENWESRRNESKEGGRVISFRVSLARGLQTFLTGPIMRKQLSCNNTYAYGIASWYFYSDLFYSVVCVCFHAIGDPQNCSYEPLMAHELQFGKKYYKSY